MSCGRHSNQHWTNINLIPTSITMRETMAKENSIGMWRLRMCRQSPIRLSYLLYRLIARIFQDFKQLDRKYVPRLRMTRPQIVFPSENSPQTYFYNYLISCLSRIFALRDSLLGWLLLFLYYQVTGKSGLGQICLGCGNCSPRKIIPKKRDVSTGRQYMVDFTLTALSSPDKVVKYLASLVCGTGVGYG